MITIAQRKKLKRLFKSGYSKDIQAVLIERSVVNKKGKPFGESYIRHVFNGINSNSDIEEAIFDLYQKRYNEVLKKHSERESILKSEIIEQ